MDVFIALVELIVWVTRYALQLRQERHPRVIRCRSWRSWKD